jgi:phosphate:Na+ symporter
MVDAYEDKLSSYLVKLASKSLSQEESHSVTKLLHVIGDVERISDHSVNVLGVAEEIYRKNIVFSEEAQHEIVVLTSAVNDIIALTAKVLINDDLELAKQIEPFEEIIDRLKKKMKNNHVQRLQKSECTIEMGFVFADLLANCERASDHCSNIAVCLLEIANDSFETHEYLNHIKNDGDKQFEENYKKYKMRYHL